MREVSSFRNLRRDRGLRCRAVATADRLPASRFLVTISVPTSNSFAAHVWWHEPEWPRCRLRHAPPAASARWSRRCRVRWPAPA